MPLWIVMKKYINIKKQNIYIYLKRTKTDCWSAASMNYPIQIIYMLKKKN